MGPFIGSYGILGHPVLHLQVARRAKWCRVFPPGRSIETPHYYVIARPTPRLDMGDTGKEQFNAHFDPLTANAPNYWDSDNFADASHDVLRRPRSWRLGTLPRLGEPRRRRGIIRPRRAPVARA